MAILTCVYCEKNNHPSLYHPAAIYRFKKLLKKNPLLKREISKGRFLNGREVCSSSSRETGSSGLAWKRPKINHSTCRCLSPFLLTTALGVGFSRHSFSLKRPWSVTVSAVALGFLVSVFFCSQCHSRKGRTGSALKILYLVCCTFTST